MTVQTLIVKLTQTGGDNSASNPGNALDSDDVRAQISAGGGKLHRTNGDHDATFLGVISKVEVITEVKKYDATPSTVLVYQWWDDGGDQAYTEHEVPEADTVVTHDATEDRAWTWADFASALLEAQVWTKPGTGQCLVDQLAYRVTYDDQYTLKKSLRPCIFDRLPYKKTITVRARDPRQSVIEDGSDASDWSEENSWATISSVSGRIRYQRSAAGTGDHILKKTFGSSQNWTAYDHLRFKIDKDVYAGAQGLKVGIYNSTSLYSVDVEDYCEFESSTDEMKAVIPLADLVAAGAALNSVNGVAFTADGDGGDYDFYMDDMDIVDLDGEGNIEYYDSGDTDVEGFADVTVGTQTRSPAGESTDKSGRFLLPKGTTVDVNDHIVYESEEYRIIGVKDDLDTHIVVDAVLFEVWS